MYEYLSECLHFTYQVKRVRKMVSPYVLNVVYLCILQSILASEIVYTMQH